MHHSGTGVAEDARTVVILHDDCYSHRYSRPRTSRANLSTIVERPERIHASILGLAIAYIRIGGRHAEGSAAPHPMKDYGALKPGAFRIQKTARRLHLKSPAVTAIHGMQWMSDLISMCDAAESKLALSGKELTRPSASTQTNGNSHTNKGKLHEGDLYLCSGSLDALEGALGGVCEGVDAVFQEHGPKRAFVCIRPPGHHCSADMPSGFCWLNNVHVGIGHAVLTHGLTHAAIIDFDLHHGDGSQSITWAHNAKVASMPKNTSISKRTAIGYFSLHDINSYPCEMGEDEKVRNASLCIENAHGQSMWNVHLQPWKTEAEFWQLYEDKYSVILTKARNFLQLHSDKLRQAPTHPKPKAAIFLSAGFDASEWESPGMQRHQVNVPTGFYARLTRDVVAMAEEEGLGVDGRVISVLEGGYSDRALMSGTLSHISGLTMAASTTGQIKRSDGLGSETVRKLGHLDLNGCSHTPVAPATNGFDDNCNPEWWALQRLEELENLVNPPTSAAVAPKKQRSEMRPTYTSATQSYTAKIVTPPKNRRSYSGAGANLSQVVVSRPQTPPPPAVDWATAAYELSKLLVPSDRETKSCKPEDLNAEASRARRDRFSAVGLPESTEGPINVPDPKRMQLRDRRGKTPQYVSEDEEELPKSKASRRKTIADVSLLVEDAQNPNQQLNPVGARTLTRQARRRSSIASNASSTNAEKGSDISPGVATEILSKRQPLVVSKTRVTSNPRAEATRQKIVKKQPPVPRFSSNPSISSATSISEHQASAASTHAGAKEPLTVNDESGNKDLDQLSSGMRTMSLKLNVPPKEEYEARQIKAKAAPRGRPRKPAAGKAASPTKSKTKVIKNPSLPKLLSTGNLPVEQLPPPVSAATLGQGPEAASPPPPPSTLPLQPTASKMPVDTRTATATEVELPIPPHDSDIGAQIMNPTNNSLNTENKVEMSSLASQPAVAPLQHSPKNTHPSTPMTAKRIKQDLPVFTSTSPISFRKPDVISGPIEQNLNRDPEGLSGSGQNGLHLFP